jgi:hypothetical protein
MDDVYAAAGVRYALSLNKWAANRPGTTYFLPIAELTARPARRRRGLPRLDDLPIDPTGGFQRQYARFLG